MTCRLQNLVGTVQCCCWDSGRWLQSAVGCQMFPSSGFLAAQSSQRTPLLRPTTDRSSALFHKAAVLRWSLPNVTKCLDKSVNKDQLGSLSRSVDHIIQTSQNRQANRCSHSHMHQHLRKQIRHKQSGNKMLGVERTWSGEASCLAKSCSDAPGTYLGCMGLGEHYRPGQHTCGEQQKVSWLPCCFLSA